MITWSSSSRTRPSCAFRGVCGRGDRHAVPRRRSSSPCHPWSRAREVWVLRYGWRSCTAHDRQPYARRVAASTRRSWSRPGHAATAVQGAIMSARRHVRRICAHPPDDVLIDVAERVITHADSTWNSTRSRTSITQAAVERSARPASASESAVSPSARPLPRRGRARRRAASAAVGAPEERLRAADARDDALRRQRPTSAAAPARGRRRRRRRRPSSSRSR